MNVIKRVHRHIFFVALVVVLAGCEMPSGYGGTNAWIDVPVDGITVPEGKIINIEGHTSSREGTTKIEIWINGELYFEIGDPPTEGKLSRFSQEWLPPGPGEYTIQVLAISGDGSSSDPDNARVQVGAPIAELLESVVEFPEPDLTITGVSLVGDDVVQCDFSNLGGAVLPEGREVWIDIFIGPSEAEFVQIVHSNIGVDYLFEAGDSGYFTSAPISPAPTWPQVASCSIDVGNLVAESNEGNNDMQSTLGSLAAMQEMTARFWVEPEQIQAGACANLYWEVENAQSVLLGSTEVKHQGRYEACHCKDELYRLTVTDLNGVTEEHRVTVRVTGDCTSPQAESGGEESTSSGESSAPSGDSKAPSAPKQLKPVNGVDLGCISSTMLRWEAVSDESGIAEYQVELQRHPGDNNWTNASGSPFTGIGGLQKEISVECGWEYRWRVRAIDGAGNTGNWSGWFTFVIPLT
ncbi:MAG: Ig-like domain-containing protein [Chloroflexi bacterium]|nr:Ig-like domain-containing protein [Chloroflexota bacterium]